MISHDGLHRPAYDLDLIRVEHHVRDLEVALPYIRGRRCAIQAGGAYGIWPRYLASRFDAVYTFEPDQENFACLVQNLMPNIYPFRAALGAKSGRCAIERDEKHTYNAGAGFVALGGAIPVLPLDAFGFAECDFLCLDVEGYEEPALEGAQLLIERTHPVIMLEAKPLPQMKDYGLTESSAIEYLTARGYTVCAKVHRDVVLVHA